MTDAVEPMKSRNNIWRIARGTVACVMLLIPLVMMQFVEDWNWTILDFLTAGTIIGGIGLIYEYAERRSGSRAFRAGAALALLACFLMVWSTLVRDDGNGMMFFEIIMAGAVGAYASRLHPAGLSRTMAGLAVMQALLGLAIATAPITAAIPGGPVRALVYCGFFAVMWLLSAGCFRSAARQEA